MLKSLLTLVFLSGMLFPSVFFAQSSSQVFVVEMDQQPLDRFDFSNPRLITYDNRDYYNNQPAFLDSLLLITFSVDTTQTDLMLFDLNQGIRYRLTNSLESEYSPTITPDRKHVSMIRVAQDEEGSQQLWRMPLDLSSEPELLLDRIKKVGYHEWIDENRVVLFIVGDPHQLKLYDVNTQRFDPVKSDIGRCFKQAASGDFYYVDKSMESIWFIKSINFDQRRPAFTIIETLNDQEDFAITKDGVLLMGKGSKLYKFRPNQDEKWMELIDMSDWGIRNISRIALGNGKIAIVSSP